MSHHLSARRSRRTKSSWGLDFWYMQYDMIESLYNCLFCRFPNQTLLCLDKLHWIYVEEIQWRVWSGRTSPLTKVLDVRVLSFLYTDKTRYANLIIKMILNINYILVSRIHVTKMLIWIYFISDKTNGFCDMALIFGMCEVTWRLMVIMAQNKHR